MYKSEIVQETLSSVEVVEMFASLSDSDSPTLLRSSSYFIFHSDDYKHYYSSHCLTLKMTFPPSLVLADTLFYIVMILSTNAVLLNYVYGFVTGDVLFS
jgi:hypothetical protein